MKEVNLSKLAYMPRLDGLRGIAMSAVLVDHFVSNGVIHGLALGGFGVLTFFVLSGYLITSILLRYREI
jgi:peptidoglycan/LPS O-acetylase OafA/YrhL